MPCNFDGPSFSINPVKRSQSRSAGQDFDMKQPLKVIHFAINYRLTRGSILPYNIAGLISEVSEEVAT